jgi:dTDP-glucose 4,6-dehydratase
MNLNQGTVLVTGAAGFIGSHLVEALMREGVQVRAFVHYNSRGSFGLLEALGPMLKDVEIITGDLRDHDRVRHAVQGCAAIFHLGALIGIPYSYTSPADVVATNVGGTLNILDAARHLGIERTVLTSTSEVYGTPLYVPIDEKHPLQAQSPYAASKIAADKLGESYFNTFDVPVTIVRPFNTYGPRQSARAIVPTIITQALALGRVRLGSLHPRRDLLYVEDTVSGFIAAAKTEPAVGRVINLGTGGDLSIGELAEHIILTLGISAPIEHDENRVRPTHSEVQRLLANYTLATELLGWQPHYTLEEGLRRTIHYVKEHLADYRAELYHV